MGGFNQTWRGEDVNRKWGNKAHTACPAAPSSSTTQEASLSTPQKIKNNIFCSSPPESKGVVTPKDCIVNRHSKGLFSEVPKGEGATDTTQSKVGGKPNHGKNAEEKELHNENTPVKKFMALIYFRARVRLVID